MTVSSLEVSYYKGRALAAYLYLDHRSGIRGVKTKLMPHGLVIDIGEDGRAIGVEIVHPSLATVADVNRALRSIGAEPIGREVLASLRRRRGVHR
jgi:uncharacterized protein YuzE